MRKILLILSLFCSAIGAMAKPYEIIYLKDGNVLEGYISSQIPGRTVKVSLSWLKVSVPKEEVTIERTEYRENVSDLSNGWKEWINNNQQYVEETSSKKKYIILNTLRYNGDSKWKDVSSSKVKIINEGSNITYVSPSNKTVEIGSYEIQRIERPLRDRNLLSGIRDVIATASGEEIKGQIVNIIPGKSMTVFTEEGKNIEIENKNITRQKREKVNDEQTLKEQAEFIDCVKTKADDNGVSGIIFNQSFNEAENVIYVRSLEKDDNIEPIKIKDIREISKKKNPAYKPKYKDKPSEDDFLLTSDSVRVKGKKYGWSDVKEDKRNNTLNGTFEDLNVIYKDSIAGKLIVEYNKEKIKGPVQLYSVNKRGDDVNIDLDRAKEKEVKFEEALDMEDDIKHLIFRVSPGYYLLYRNNPKKGIIFEIK